MSTVDSHTIPITLSWFRPHLTSRSSAASVLSTISEDAAEGFAEDKSVILWTRDKNVTFLVNEAPREELEVALSTLEQGDYTTSCRMPPDQPVCFKFSIRWTPSLTIVSHQQLPVDTAAERVNSIRVDFGISTQPVCAVHPAFTVEKAEGTIIEEHSHAGLVIYPQVQRQRRAEGSDRSKRSCCNIS